MMRIRIFSEKETSLELKQKYEEYIASDVLQRYENEKKVSFVYDTSYTHAILLGQTEPVLLVDKNHVIGMSMEAKPLWRKEFVIYAKEKVGLYFTGDDEKILGAPFVNRPSFVPYAVPKHIITEKTKYMSIVVLNKRFSLGTYYSNKIVEMIVANNLPIDVYGKTDKEYSSETSSFSMYGLYPEYSKTKPYKKYTFSIVIEENISECFYSSAPVTSLMCSCIPLYFGCRRIHEYFQDKSIVPLTGNLARDMNVIMNVLKNPETFYVEIDTKKVDKKVNLLRNASELFLD